MQDVILSVQDLEVEFTLRGKTLHAIRGISLDICEGESLAIVGESGSGKSVFCKTFMGLLDSNGRVTRGSIRYGEKDLAAFKTEKEWLSVRGKEIAMVMQDPMTSLNPLFTVGEQIRNPLMRHKKMKRKEADEKARSLLEMVGIPSPEKRLNQYPHELSGGMRQRVMIAIALCCGPKLLIADEPTTALDVTIQAQILELIGQMKEQSSMSVILITHDLGVISSLCSRVLVMYGGLIMESGSLEDIFYRTGHPYTAGLLASIPKKTREKLVPIYGTPPDLLNPPAGCPFAARCPYAMELCRQYCPNLAQIGPGHESACWLHNRSVKESRGEVKLG